jgi:hypothetical protein
MIQKMKTAITVALAAFSTQSMATQITTSIRIHATPQKVWSVLTNFEHYPQWNPFITSISGTPEIGQKITARMEPPEAKGMTFTPVVLQYQLNRLFSWKGKLLVKGLFDGEHIFELIDNHDGTTTFIQSEKFNGILVPLFYKMIHQNTVNGFKQMNEQLKIQSEL